MHFYMNIQEKPALFLFMNDAVKLFRKEYIMKKLNFAVIGCGALAQGTHIPCLAQSEKANLHTCCDLSDDILTLCQTKFGAQHICKDWKAAIENPEDDAICLCTTEKLRFPVISYAAQFHKPVYVEKPLATSMEEIYKIQKAVHESGIPFCVGHNRRNSPAMRDAHDIFRKHMEDNQQEPWRWKREPGRPNRKDDGRASMSVRVNDDWYSWKGWVFDPVQAPYGPMLFEMTHFTDLCNWFMDSEPEEVVAMETGMLNHAIIIKYKTGELATLNMCANGTFGYPKELYEIMGNGAIVVVDHMCEVRTAGIPGAPAVKKYDFIKDRHQDVGIKGGIEGFREKKAAALKEAAEANDPMLQFTAEPDKGHSAALENFIDQINGLRGEVCGVDDAVCASQVAFAAIKSAREKRFVRVDEI